VTESGLPESRLAETRRTVLTYLQEWRTEAEIRQNLTEEEQAYWLYAWLYGGLVESVSHYRLTEAGRRALEESGGDA